MTVRTHVSDALDRVLDEQELVAEKRTALSQFEQRVDALQARGPNARSRPPHATDGGTVVTTTPAAPESSSTSCKAVCALFAETVLPCCRVEDDDGSVLFAMRDELGEEITLALSPKTDGQFTPQVKRAVLSAVSARQEELGTLSAALDTEETSVRTAAETVAAVTDWLVSTNDTPLSTLDFETLQKRHDELESHRDRCEEVLRDRQETLYSTTSRNGSVGVSHRSVVRSLYDEFPLAYPVLETLLRLVDCCTECQRVVRDHLVRRA
jgi:hypothetical protein